MRVTGSLGRVLAGLLVPALALPAPVWGAGGTASIGTARGAGAAEVTFDGGARWLPLGGRALPVLGGARLRSTSGAVLLDLAGGSRVNVLPFSTVRVREVAGGIDLTLEYGRLTFRLPEGSRASISTPSARLEPAGGEMAGEVFAGETTGLKMTRGTMRVRPTAVAEPVLLASLVEPVFLPKRPAASGPLFTSDLAGDGAPAGSRGVFTVQGRSLGYLRPDGGLIVYPGYTNDLTAPFAPRTVQLALAGVPARDRVVAEPLFDVNGAYVGYVAGHTFYAQAQAAPGTSGQAAPAAGAAGGLGSSLAVAVGVSAAFIGAGFGLAEVTEDDEQPATPVSP